MAIVLSGFAAIFAYALTLLKGAYGLNGWRCEFVGNSTMIGIILTAAQSRDLYYRGCYHNWCLHYWVVCRG
jgi:hypothetical protein